jgi:hypothetical protein
MLSSSSQMRSSSFTSAAFISAPTPAAMSCAAE